MTAQSPPSLWWPRLIRIMLVSLLCFGLLASILRLYIPQTLSLVLTWKGGTIFALIIGYSTLADVVLLNKVPDSQQLIRILSISASVFNLLGLAMMGGWPLLVFTHHFPSVGTQANTAVALFISSGNVGLCILFCAEWYWYRLPVRERRYLQELQRENQARRYQTRFARNPQREERWQQQFTKRAVIRLQEVSRPKRILGWIGCLSSLALPIIALIMLLSQPPHTDWSGISVGLALGGIFLCIATLSLLPRQKRRKRLWWQTREFDNLGN